MINDTQVWGAENPVVYIIELSWQVFLFFNHSSIPTNLRVSIYRGIYYIPVIATPLLLLWFGDGFTIIISALSIVLNN